MTKRGPREPGTEPRKRLTKKRRAQLFLDRKGRCHRCGCKIAAGGRWIAEHYIALSNGGTNEWSNWDLTCMACFHPKNKSDAKQGSKRRRIHAASARHAARMADKGNLIPVAVWGEMGERSRHRPMAGNRNSPFKKHMDGRVSRR